jgi:hypothetical protein
MNVSIKSGRGAAHPSIFAYPSTPLNPALVHQIFTCEAILPHFNIGVKDYTPKRNPCFAPARGYD